LNLGPTPTDAFILPPDSETEYKIVVRQQPVRARMCGFGEKDRRPIDPPPVIKLLELKAPTPDAQLQCLIVQCTLWDEDGKENRDIIRTTTGATSGLGSAEELPGQVEEKHARVLMGEHFASAIELEDIGGERGIFYIFPDLSIRVEGRYRLKFDLIRLCLPPQPGTRPNQLISECMSNIFVVFAAKKFPGMMQSTELTKAIALQGFKIGGVRSETRVRRDRQESSIAKKRSEKRRASTSSNIEEEEEAASPVSSETKRKRSAER
jgi:hypothetical protein